jgi:hypothetical protein
VVVTVPLPAARRLTLARSGGTFWWALWRERCVAPSDWDEPPGGSGVREPRRPVPPRSGGSVALPLG